MAFLDPKAQFASIRNEILDAVTHTLESQHFILRLEVEALEKEDSVVTGCKDSTGCTSGSHMLKVASLALVTGHGDEVMSVADEEAIFLVAPRSERSWSSLSKSSAANGSGSDRSFACKRRL